MVRRLCFLLFTLVLSIPAAAQEAFVRGVVVDSVGRPLADANVVARTPGRAREDTGRVIATATSDSQGHFVIGQIPGKSRYIFSARKIGYLVANSDPTNLPGGDTTDLRFELSQTTLAPVKIVASLPRAYYIDTTEIKKHSVHDALDVVMLYRPRMLGDVYKNCSPDTSILTVDSRQYSVFRPKFLGDPRAFPLQLYVNGRRETVRGIKDILAQIPADDILEMRYVNCWDETTPQFRNSLSVVLKPGKEY